MIISTLINDALIEIGVLSAIDEAAPEDHAFALRTLNRIIDLYNTQNLITSYLQDIEYEMPDTEWTSPITIGAGLQFDGVAPSFVDNAFFRQDETDYPLTMMAGNTWSKIAVKSVKSIPSRYYRHAIDENGLNIYFDVIPQDDLTLHLMCKMPINSGAKFKATDDIVFSFGVEKMLLGRLALELCPTYEVVPSQMLLGKALEAEDNVKTYSYKPSTLSRGRAFKRSGSRRNRARG